MKNMETVQIAIDKKLLRAADQAARRTKRNRSSLVRNALREHLGRLEIRDPRNATAPAIQNSGSPAMR